MRDKSTIDFSQFPIGQGKNINPESFEVFGQKMKKKDGIYGLIFIIVVISTIIFFTIFFNKREISRGPVLPGSPPSAAEGGI